MQFVPGQSYPRGDVERAFAGAERLGPFLVAEGASAFVARLGDGPGDPSFPDRSTLHWPGTVPRRAVERARTLLAFVERGPDELEFVGEASVTRYTGGGGGSEVRDVSLHLRTPRPRAAWLSDLGARIPRDGSPLPDAAIGALAPRAGPDDRWIALSSFIERWYGAAPSLRGRSELGRVGPPLLRRILAVRSELPDLFAQNHLVAPEDLAIEGGRVEFLRENQGACAWATEPEGADPRVWCRLNATAEPWVEEPEPLSGFLIEAVLFEAILCARFGASTSLVDEATVNAILAHVDPLALARWHWGRARFYARGGVLAMTMENDGAVDVWLAAKSPLALSPFDDVVTPSWNRIAF